MNTYKPFTALAGFMGVYHLLIGILGLVSGEMAARVGAAVYGAHVEVTPLFSYMAKYLAAYVITFGVMMLFMAGPVARGENRMRMRRISSTRRATSTPRYRSGSTMGKMVATAANTANAPQGFSTATISGLLGN